VSSLLENLAFAGQLGDPNQIENKMIELHRSRAKLGT
jgi:hypothetical protein